MCIALFSVFGLQADKRDITTVCNKLSNMHFKNVKNHHFSLSSNRVHPWVMHSSRSYLLNVLHFVQKSCGCCHGNHITVAPDIPKMLVLP